MPVLIIQSEDYQWSSGIFSTCENTSSLSFKVLSFQKLSRRLKFCCNFWCHKDRSALPGSCDRWRCPCWTGLAPHTRMRCCCGLRGWGWAHHWTGRRRCWFGRSAGARGGQSSSLPCAAGIAPRERQRREQPTVKSNYRIKSTKDTWFTTCFQGWKCLPPHCSNFWAAVCSFKHSYKGMLNEITTRSLP